MDRHAQEYAAAMAFAQQQQQQANIQQQQFGFQQQPQQYSHQAHGPPFLPHPSVQQFPPYQRHLPPQQQLYPHHQNPFLHPQQQQLPPHGFAPHQPPYHMPPGYMHPLDSAPPPTAAAPSDPELQKRIDKLVEYVVKNGPQFEAMVREKEQDNPDYSFLFGAEGHSYYRYKLWLTRNPPAAFNQAFQPTSGSMMPSAHSPLGNSPSVSPPLGAGAPGSMFGASAMHQPPYPPLYDQQQQPPPSQSYVGHSRVDYDHTSKTFKGLSGPLPSDVAGELNNVLANLSGTKESIKGAKMWFMQRSPFAPALAESLRDRIFSLDDPERQLHIIYLANDILFDSLQRRMNPQELDNEALAFRPVLGSMLARIYNNPQNKESNQSRLEKIIQFWASKEVYGQETISNLEREMTGGLAYRSMPLKDGTPGLDRSNLPGLLPAPHQLPDVQNSALGGSANQQETRNLFPPSVPSQFMANQLVGGMYPAVAQPASLLIQHPVPATGQPSIPPFQPNAVTGSIDQAPPPYPLFPPGLIPGMVRKMQVGSGVPYSPMSPLDIPTVIPPSTVPPSEMLERVSKFFKEIGEVNPSEGPMHGSESNDEDDYEREQDVRKGGARIPPPPMLQVDPETGMSADGSFERKPGSSISGKLGLGATADPNEVSQYDDVYSSYRKQRSTSYHSSMSSRAATR